MSDVGKGSVPRPFSVSNEEYANRWDAIFGRDLKQEDAPVNAVGDGSAVAGLGVGAQGEPGVKKKKKKEVVPFKVFKR